MTRFFSAVQNGVLRQRSFIPVAGSDVEFLIPENLTTRHPQQKHPLESRSGGYFDI
ncbi:MAG: hypothetical protein QF898_09110 [SAR202 cluster bacterium]|nr:hypothetical protein [SAR202 cluster bacterium]